MTASNPSLPDGRLSELHALAAASLDGELSDGQLARLDRLVCGDAGLCKHYVRYMYISWSLRGWAKYPLPATEEREPALAAPAALPLSPAVLPIICQVSPASYGSPGLFAPGGWLFSYGAATVITGAMLLVLWALTVSHDYAITGPSSPSMAAVIQHEKQPEPRPEMVGQITGTADCRWADPQTAPPDSTRLSPWATGMSWPRDSWKSPTRRAPR